MARAAADGHTLLYTTNTTFTINPVLRGSLGYDPLQSFTPIGLVGGSSVVLLAHPSVAAGTVAELVALARARPGELNYASFGVGTISHLAGELFKSVAGVDLVHVPHQGSAPAMQALIGGQVQLSFDVLVAAVRPIAAGRVKPLVLTSRRRSALLPDLPTMIESGYAGFDVSPWAALLAPRGLPRQVLDRLTAALADALADVSVSAELRGAGVELAPEPPEAYAPRVEQELSWVRRTAAQAGIKTE